MAKEKKPKKKGGTVVNNITGPVRIEGTRVLNEAGEEVAQVGITFGTTGPKKGKG